MNNKNLKLKIGLEIHKELESHKLFCHCPSIIDNERPDSVIRRRQRAVAGEAGKKDVAALYEEGKDREFIYEYSPRYACLVCLDEEPPFPVNEHALKTALEIAMLFHMQVEKKLKVMRKIIVDGSNTSSYQRLILLAKNGYVNTSKGKVRILSMNLEEDSARKIREDEKSITYRLDRLGIPLVEITTGPDIKDSEHAKETAGLIGMILKSTGKVKTGIGTIRQDINISILNKGRVELKGFQDLRIMPKIIDNEIRRQLDIVNKKERVREEVRKVNPDGNTTFLRPLPGKARIYPDTDLPEIEVNNEMLNSIKISELIIDKAIHLEEKYGLREDLAKEIIDDEIDFEDYVKKFSNVKPEFIARVLVDMRKEIKTRFDLETKPDDILEYLNDGKISEINFFELLVEKAEGKKINLEKYKQPEDLESEIRKIIKENKGASFNAIMGEVMKRFRGKVDPKKIAELIKKEV